MYSCEGEYNDVMNRQARAEAEYQQEVAYNEFLNNLIDNKEYYLHSIYISIDELYRNNKNKEFDLAINHLTNLKNKYEVKINEPLDINNTDLPF